MAAQYLPWRDKEFLRERYVTKRMTLKQIADECRSMGLSVTEMTIWNNLKKHGLLTNPRNLGSRSVGGKSKNGFYG